MRISDWSSDVCSSDLARGARSSSRWSDASGRSYRSLPPLHGAGWTMIFRQLFEQESSTYTYLIACGDTKRAVLIDPVLETVGRDLAVLAELGLELEYSLETHIHADHITAACRLRSLPGCKVASPEKQERERVR